jgi:hypothetical protein
VVQQPTLTLTDVAELARVRRPVVSTWRRRPRARGGVQIPFPQPVSSAGGVESFDRDEVVAWLEKTGRGNNVEARQDAPAVSVPGGVDVEDIVVLLCLHALTGEELDGLSNSQLADLAERADPHDQLVLREVRALADAPALTRYVDDLIEASFGLEDALARVESGRLRREAAERGLTEGVVELVRAVASVCRVHLGDETVALVPPPERQLTRGVGAGFAGLLLDPDDSATRGQRRRARIGSVEVLDGAAATVRVLCVVGESAVEALDAVDNLAVSLGLSDVGIVLGPAAALCDRLLSDAEQRRSQTLRPGVLTIAVRLPRGLWKAAHRQNLALWVLRGGRSAQWFYAADLDAIAVDLGDLASDVAGALGLTEERAFRYARRADLVPVLAGAPVVPRGVRAVRLGNAGPVAYLDRIHVASLTTGMGVEGYDVTVAPAPAQIVLRQRSLAELEAAGHLAVRRGSRIDITHTAAAGSVRLLIADGSMDHLRLDPLDAERYYPHAVRTEPGDVVFDHRPRPAARVDAEGGALVSSPSRIMRLRRTAPFGPYVLAALVNELAPVNSEWQTWSVPDLPAAESVALDAALKNATHHLAELRRHELAVQDLTKSLIEGVAAGAVTLDPTVTQRAG